MSTAKTKKSTTGKTPLLPRISMQEFIAFHRELDEMQVAGFRVTVEGKEWMRINEWETALEDYLNR